MSLINGFTTSAKNLTYRFQIKATSYKKKDDALMNSLDDAITGLNEMLECLNEYESDMSIIIDIEVYSDFRDNDDSELNKAENKLPKYLQLIYDEYRVENPMERPNTQKETIKTFDQHIDFITTLLEMTREHKDKLEDDNKNITFEDIVYDVNRIKEKKIYQHTVENEQKD